MKSYFTSNINTKFFPTSVQLCVDVKKPNDNTVSPELQALFIISTPGFIYEPPVKIYFARMPYIKPLTFEGKMVRNLR